MKRAINLATDTGIVHRNENTTRYYKDIHDYPTLTREEEIKWFHQYRTGTEKEREEAKEFLIMCNQRLVISIAKKWANFDNLTDYINEANFGLIRAIEKFDETKGNKFSSYAVWHILLSINNYNNYTVPMIRPTNLSQTFHVISKATNDLTQKYERAPSTEEVKDYINKKYNKSIKEKNDLLSVQYTAIDDGVNDDSDSVYGEIINYNRQSANTNEFEEKTNNEYNKKLINTLLKALTKREQQIIKMKYGLIEFNGIKREFELCEIADELNLSTERVRQLEIQAIQKLKKEYGERIHQLL